MQQELSALICKSLVEQIEHLRNEIRDLVRPVSEAGLWKKPVNPGNSIGHLLLHLAGNLNHFVGAQLGGTGYVRDREREFKETSPPPRDQLLNNLDDAVATFRRVVLSKNSEQLAAPHPHEKFGSVLNALVHIVAHFALHRGQITYLSRLVASGH